MQGYFIHGVGVYLQSNSCADLILRKLNGKTLKTQKFVLIDWKNSGEDKDIVQKMGALLKI